MTEFENEKIEGEIAKDNVSSDNVGHVPTVSDSVRPSPSSSDSVGHSADSSLNEVWLTTDEIVQRLFDKFDVKRDRRSAERYCHSGKVKAFLDDAQGIWFAEQSSVDILAAQLLEIQNRRGQGYQSATKESGQERDSLDENSAKDLRQGSGDREAIQSGLHDLRAQVMQLEFEVKSKSEIINHLQSAREKDRDRFIELASESGEYKAEVKQLRATLQLADGGVQESINISEYDESGSILSQNLPPSEDDSISDATQK
jgi:hypothetical protein